MHLGTEDIRYELEYGRIVCTPSPERIESAQIDVTLGAHTYVFRPPLLASPDIDLRQVDPATVFQYRHAIDGSIVIPARSFVLCHTEEFIGTAPGSGILPLLYTRSTFARWGLSVHEGAGLGDVGFMSRWTLQIQNPHDVVIRVPVGARVGCIVFSRIGGAAADYTPGTRYNVEPGKWSPTAMLPRTGNW